MANDINRERLVADDGKQRPAAATPQKGASLPQEAVTQPETPAQKKKQAAAAQPPQPPRPDRDTRVGQRPSGNQAAGSGKSTPNIDRETGSGDAEVAPAPVEPPSGPAAGGIDGADARAPTVGPDKDLF
jgi:hypothetical protein